MIIVEFFLLVIFTFLFKDSFIISESIEYRFYILIFLAWIISIWLTHKHKPKYYQLKLKYILAPFPKAYFIFIFNILIFSLFNSSFEINLINIIKFITLYSFVEIIIIIAIVYLRKKSKNVINNQNSIEIKKYIQDDLVLDENVKYIQEGLLKKVIPEDLFNKINDLYKKVCFQDISDSNQNDFAYIDYKDLNSIQNNSLSLLILKNRINDLHDINLIQRECYSKIKSGGILIANYNNIEQTNSKLRKKYWIFFPLVFVFHVLFYRILSKVSSFSNLYKLISKGKNHILSWVEVSGRLVYNGFEVEIEENKQDTQYLIAKKTKSLSDNPNPSFNLLIKLNRVSLYGNIIKINKVRSMYPYSEFLQKKIFEQNNLSNSGKFNNDPRITPQGKIFRKYWIDELPQFFDWLRGEIKLVGIRAMSQHFFSLYSQQYRDLFHQVKPGIISPIFDEKTASFEDIERIEFEYLESYIKNPNKTDWKYFWLTFKNILSGVRSK